MRERCVKMKVRGDDPMECMCVAETRGCAIAHIGTSTGGYGGGGALRSFGMGGGCAITDVDACTCGCDGVMHCGHSAWVVVVVLMVTKGR